MSNKVDKRRVLENNKSASIRAEKMKSLLPASMKYLTHIFNRSESTVERALRKIGAVRVGDKWERDVKIADLGVSKTLTCKEL